MRLEDSDSASLGSNPSAPASQNVGFSGEIRTRHSGQTGTEGVSMPHTTRHSRQEPTGYVYFIKMQPDANPYDAEPFVKIGYAKDPDQRLAQLSTSLPFEIDIEATFRGSPADERWLHRKLAAYRVRREWFRLSKSMEKFLDRLSDASFVVFIERNQPHYEPTLRECLACKQPSERLSVLIKAAAAEGRNLELSPKISIRFEERPA